MTPDYKALRDLALKATPGPWAMQPHSHWKSGAQVYAVRAFGFVAECGTSEEDAAFIAAANPQTVIALLDDNAQLREACAKWQNHFTDTPGLAAANAEIVSLRAQLAAMTKARDELAEIANDYVVHSYDGQRHVRDTCESDDLLSQANAALKATEATANRIAELRKVGQR